VTQLNLSARAYHRIQKLVRMIADLAESEEIQSIHLAAISSKIDVELNVDPSSESKIR